MKPSNRISPLQMEPYPFFLGSINLLSETCSYPSFKARDAFQIASPKPVWTPTSLIGQDRCKFFQDYFLIREIFNLKEELQKKYGIEIRSVVRKERITHAGETARLNPSPLALQMVQLRKLKSQLSKVPPEFIKSLSLKQLRLCGKIETPAGEGKWQETYHAFTDFSNPDNTMYLHQTWAFYHELFHVLDDQHGGAFSFQDLIDLSTQSSPGRLIENQVWKDLDPHSELDPELYDEEQAEVARMLFSLDEPTHRERYEKMRQDSGQQKKILQMQKWLLEWSGGKLNGQYWNDLEAGKVDENYWK